MTTPATWGSAETRTPRQGLDEEAGGQEEPGVLAPVHGRQRKLLSPIYVQPVLLGRWRGLSVIALERGRGRIALVAQFNRRGCGRCNCHFELMDKKNGSCRTAVRKGIIEAHHHDFIQGPGVGYSFLVQARSELDLRGLGSCLNPARPLTHF